jgi:hypothetical protein
MGLESEFENFHIHEEESIENMYSRYGIFEMNLINLENRCLILKL